MRRRPPRGGQLRNCSTAGVVLSLALCGAFIFSDWEIKEDVKLGFGVTTLTSTSTPWKAGKFRHPAVSSNTRIFATNSEQEPESKPTPYFKKASFDNTGGFKFMQPVIDAVYEPGSGKEIAFGVTKRKVTGPPPSPEEQQRRRQKAKDELVNISDDERQRRRTVSNVLYGVSIGMAALLLFTPVPAVSRLGLYLPLTFASAYGDSAKMGL